MLNRLLTAACLATYAIVPVFVLAAGADESAIRIDSPMAPPAWALLERELLRANAKACEEFFNKYFDERGFLLCVERWGGDDGPDDAIENLGVPVPCRSYDPEVFFAESPADVEYAKSLCRTCPLMEACLAGAKERREPWGVWGGELFVQGVVVARKRPRGRPRKNPVTA